MLGRLKFHPNRTLLSEEEGWGTVCPETLHPLQGPACGSFLFTHNVGQFISLHLLEVT